MIGHGSRAMVLAVSGSVRISGLITVGYFETPSATLVQPPGAGGAAGGGRGANGQGPGLGRRGGGEAGDACAAVGGGGGGGAYGSDGTSGGDSGDLLLGTAWGGLAGSLNGRADLMPLRGGSIRIAWTKTFSPATCRSTGCRSRIYVSARAAITG